MGVIDDRVRELDLELPPEIVVPEGVVLPFRFVHIAGERAFCSGHGPQGRDGAMEGPFGLVGADVSEDDAIAAARLTALSMPGSLQRELGSLDRVHAGCGFLGWLRRRPASTGNRP